MRPKPIKNTMSEALTEIANEAGFVFIKDDGIGWAGNYNASLEKFAKLILKRVHENMNDIDVIRKAFEEVCYPSFGVTSGHSLRRKPNGEYVSDSLEDHWQTFQEGWEEAIKYLKNKSNSCYTDIVSDGGMDPRK